MSEVNFTFEWFGEAVIVATKQAARDSLVESAYDLAEKAAADAPIDKGDLRANAQVDVDNVESGEFSVYFDLPYALIQHENLDFNHPGGGKAKYLEDQFNANYQKYLDDAAEAVEKETS